MEWKQIIKGVWQCRFPSMAQCSAVVCAPGTPPPPKVERRKKKKEISRILKAHLPKWFTSLKMGRKSSFIISKESHLYMLHQHPSHNSLPFIQQCHVFTLIQSLSLNTWHSNASQLAFIEILIMQFYMYIVVLLHLDQFPLGVSKRKRHMR